MHSKCPDATAGLSCVFRQPPSTLATIAIILNYMFVHTVGQDESVHMHSLAIASTAGLYQMINFKMKLARICLYYKYKLFIQHLTSVQRFIAI